MKKVTTWIIAGIMVIVVTGFLFRSNNSPATAPTTTNSMNNDSYEQTLGAKTYTAAPTPFLSNDKKYFVRLKTEQGDIVIELFQKDTPQAASNFAFLAKDGFYDNLTFHRIIKGFMIQGGDPDGDGTGGPGYKFKDEPITKDYKRGMVAYANAGANTNGSQFFIMHNDYPLPKNYVIFGQVVEGLEVVDKIAETQVEPNMTGENSSPKEPVFITSATLEEK